MSEKAQVTYVQQHPAYVQQQPAVVYQQSNVPVGPYATRLTCPSCLANVVTRVEIEPSGKTHLLALLCCLIICLPCIPYCIDSCQNTNHYCPSCGVFLGTYK